MKYFFVFVILITFSGTQNASAQTRRFKTYGGEIGYGNTFSENTTYKMVLTMADFSWSFKKFPKKKDFVGWYVDPQFNLVKATNTKGIDVETGVNLGIRNYVMVNEHFLLYQMLGSGPHYYTADLDRQAPGFIFSDNLAIGSFINISDNLFLNLQFGIRHISNANIELPNRGVNSFIFMAGLSGIKFAKRG
ncbi:MAG: acyloxyacyl hydrolase [Flavisolibacter sp.]|jgi:hypothetical protein